MEILKITADEYETLKLPATEWLFPRERIVCMSKDNEGVTLVLEHGVKLHIPHGALSLPLEWFGETTTEIAHVTKEHFDQVVEIRRLAALKQKAAKEAETAAREAAFRAAQEKGPEVKEAPPIMTVPAAAMHLLPPAPGSGR